MRLGAKTTRVKLTLAYDGGGFSGWAAQPGLRTVEGELTAALEQVLQRTVRLTVAGRTDAGVHAWAQVASFELDGEPPRELMRGVNAVGPDDVAVTAVEPAPDGFDARRDARSRTYCYRILDSPAPSPFERGRALWWPHPVELDRLRRCAELLRGTHDFTAFTPTATDHVRFERDILSAEWVRRPAAHPPGAQAGASSRGFQSCECMWAQPPRPPSGRPPPAGAEQPGGIDFWIEADAFMRHMVRVLVGTMLEVAGGRRAITDFGRLLEGAPRDAAGPTAPPDGLYLASVRY